ncbi:MAG: aminomethyl-transferring glycine dehydrogenase subunit GcvPA [Thermoleophilia bacterium]|nr:aminomethyl-transferring glycine dehydrogenase subunit GcvPA [Thermoleophilia bacterium]
MRTTAHPYMANSVPAVKQVMLDAIGAASIEELFAQIPEGHRLRGGLPLPPSLASEIELSRHLRQTLARNETCEDNLSFLGAGCWQHHVPAICDEVVRRSEFVTPVWGTPSSDYGRNQAWFEFCSQLGELLDLDFVGLPVYSWGCAAGHAIRMAARMNGRREVLVPRSLDPERLAVIRTFCEPRETASHLTVTLVDFDPQTGRVDLDDLRAKLGGEVAAVYFETPSYLGTIERDAAEITRLAHDAGAEAIVGVDPISLGVLAPPPDYGADIAVGTIQPLGVHMNCGGGVGGFIASRDEERYAREYPTLNLSICDTVVPGERGFGIALFHQTSYGLREEGNDWTGNSTYLWSIAAATYMSLLGPKGFADLGELIVQRSHYAASLLDELDGVRVAWPGGFFKEFVVAFDGKTVADVNRGLRAHRIFGGKDLSRELPELGQSALYCVTEVHTKDDIERLVGALREVIAA